MCNTKGKTFFDILDFVPLVTKKKRGTLLHPSHSSINQSPLSPGDLYKYTQKLRAFFTA